MKKSYIMRAIAVVMSVVVVLSLTISVSADSVNYLNGLSNITGNATRQFWNIVGEVVTGNKSFSDARNDLSSLADEIGSETLKNVVTNYLEESFDRLVFLRQIMDAAVDVGDDISDFIEDLLKKNGIENETSANISGAGAVLAYYDGKFSDGEPRYRVYYGEYGVLDEWKNGSRQIAINNIFRFEIHKGSFPGSVTYSEDETSSGLGTMQYSTSEFYFIGDWRTESDEPVDDSELTEPDLAPPSIDDAEDDELIDLLNELLNALNMQFPDLSTVEGLLRAILSQCQSINSKMDNQGSSNGVDVTELQLLLDASIVSLINNDDKNTNELLNELIGFRNDFKYIFEQLGIDIGSDDVGGEGEEDVGYTDAEIQEAINKLGSTLGKLFNVNYQSSDTAAVSDDSLTTVYAGTTYSASAVVTITKLLPSVVNVKGLGKIGVKLLISLVDLIVSIVETVPVYAVTGLMANMQGIMYGSTTPTDLKFTLTLNEQETEFTLIPASLLEQDGYKDALNIIRALVGFIILYTWLKWARKFTISMV